MLRVLTVSCLFDFFSSFQSAFANVVGSVIEHYRDVANKVTVFVRLVQESEQRLSFKSQGIITNFDGFSTNCTNQSNHCPRPTTIDSGMI